MFVKFFIHILLHIVLHLSHLCIDGERDAENGSSVYKCLGNMETIIITAVEYCIFSFVSGVITAVY